MAKVIVYDSLGIVGWFYDYFREPSHSYIKCRLHVLTLAQHYRGGFLGSILDEEAASERESLESRLIQSLSNHFVLSCDRTENLRILHALL